MNTVSCVAPINIAVIKYWGKRDESLILPINDSVSGTLDTEQLCAHTTVATGPHLKEDRVWLNGKETELPKLSGCLREIKKKAKLSGNTNDWKIHICSWNNFPTAAGLASSAAGYACLVVALAKLYNIENEDLSPIARVGSGSACRSVLGGFVRWHMGSKPDGSDSIAKQIVPASYWPEMRVLILVVNDAKKKVSSAVGMKRSLQTSELMKQRVVCANERANKIQSAIIARDFETFAEITMKDSNQMHAICLDAYPPFVYMNDISHAIIQLVHAYNTAIGKTKVAYTFDAGPNATLYLLQETVPKFMGLLDYIFPPLANSDVEYKRGIPTEIISPTEDLLKEVGLEAQHPGKLKYIFHTKLGDGPRYVQDHLLDEQGWPKKLI